MDSARWMGISQALEEKLCSGGGGAGRETRSWNSMLGSEQGGPQRGSRREAWETFVCLFLFCLFVCCFLAAFLLGLKREGLVSSVFQGKESITPRATGQKEGLSETGGWV